MEIVSDVEIVAAAIEYPSAVDDQTEHEAIRQQQIRAEIDSAKKQKDRLDVIMTPIFIAMIAPGFFGGFMGTIFLSRAGYTTAAIVCGIGCGLLFVTGVTFLIYFQKKQERVEARIKELESQLGNDNRSLGEKILDKGFGWLLGKK